MWARKSNTVAVRLADAWISPAFSVRLAERYRASGGKTTKDQTIQKRTEPAFIEPMQCKAVTVLHAGENRTFDIKFDGYRCIAVRRGRELALFSRNEKVLNKRFPKIVQALASLGVISFLMENCRPGFTRETLISTSAEQSVAGASDLFLCVRFAKPRWGAFGECGNLKPARPAGQDASRARRSVATSHRYCSRLQDKFLRRCANSVWRVLWATDRFRLRTRRAIRRMDQAPR